MNNTDFLKKLTTLYFDAQIDVEEDIKSVKDQLLRVNAAKRAICELVNTERANEEWRPIKKRGIEVSNYGRVRKDGRILRQTLNNCLYLYADGIETHRLVAEAFLGECPEGFEVDHINGCTIYNNINNLRYLSRGNNQKLSKKKMMKAGRPTKAIIQYTLDGDIVKEHESIVSAVRENGWKEGINGGITRACKEGINCKGYYWRYKQ